MSKKLDHYNRVLTASSGQRAIEANRASQPDCVLLDVMLPDLDGWAVTSSVRNDRRIAATPIIMLTARIDDADKIVGLEMGADDYITKPFNPREVLARVRVQLRRTLRDVQSSQIVIGRIQLDTDRRLVHLDNQPLDLTATEFDILQAFMQNAGYAFTRDELLEKALGYTYSGLGRTLDSHIKNLRRKIEPDSRKPTYIQTVYGVGYRFTEDGT